MFEADFVKSFDVVVVELVVDFAADAVVFDNFGIAQNGELMRNSGFSHIEDVSDVADAHFALVERPKNLNASGFAEDFEEFRKTM